MPTEGIIKQCSIVLTRGCNLRCNFCYVKRAGYVEDDRIDYDYLKSIVDFCCEAKVKYIFFTGGEPLTYSHLPEILRYIKTRHHPMITAIATNGVLLKDMVLCRTLIDSGLGYIDVSMKGKDRREWCEMTGYDGSEAQHQAIRNLASLPIDFTCSMVITPENVHSFCESVQIAHDNGAKQFSFTFIIDNDDAEEKDLAYLQKHDPIKLVSDFISQIDKLSAITDDWWVEYSFPMCVYTEEQLKLLKGRLATPCQIHLKNAVTFNTKMELLPCDMYIYQQLGKFGRDFSSYQEFLSLTESANYNKTMDEIRKRADSVYVALKGGANFDSIAAKYGQNGTTQWLTSAMYENSQSIDADSKKYLETLGTLGENELANVEFMQGNVIVQVVSRRAMVEKYVAAVVKHTIDFSKDTYSAAYNKFSQFVSANQTIEAMEKNAAKFGYRVLERRDIFNSEHNVAGIGSTDDAMKWIFDEAEVGKVSPLYECGENDHLLVVALTKVHPVGYRAFDDVKDVVKADVVRDKKYEMLKEKLAGVNSVNAAKGKGARVDTVRQITFNAPVFVQATGASEPALSGAVAATKQNSFCPDVIKGNAGAYMFQVTSRSTRQGAKFDAKTMEQRLRQMALQAASRYMDELYLSAGVVDNRYLFF